jgi:hypothetical protein
MRTDLRRRRKISRDRRREHFGRELLGERAFGRERVKV